MSASIKRISQRFQEGVVIRRSICSTGLPITFRLGLASFSSNRMSLTATDAAKGGRRKAKITAYHVTIF